ncbi:hypothetical protein BDFB_014177 [Asbolus verrucosus]|uniref:Uncharacterized protein n=1 Tax=Asbolus verrucosus TaxID=1661398 RepID=A0A482VMM4_ASBVE|nr:hypothetical protein BDFB_014177 [Asbolus verrucosus]
MSAKLFAFFAFLAAVNASAIVFPETEISKVPVAKLSIVGPSGNITKEESVPVLTSKQATILETPVLHYAGLPLLLKTKPVVKHQEVSVVHPVVVHPQLPLVHPELPLVHPVVHNPLLVPTSEYHVLSTHPNVFKTVFSHGVYYTV